MVWRRSGKQRGAGRCWIGSTAKPQPAPPIGGTGLPFSARIESGHQLSVLMLMIGVAPLISGANTTGYQAVEATGIQLRASIE